MFGDGFEQSTILRGGPDGLTRVISRRSWAERESVLVEAREAELFVFRRWEEFHRRALGFVLGGVSVAKAADVEEVLSGEAKKRRRDDVAHLAPPWKPAWSGHSPVAASGPAAL